MSGRIALAAVLIAGTAGTAAAETTLTLANGIDVSITDPHKISGGGERVFANQVFEGLYGHDLDGRVVPELARSYTVSADGKVYEFKLRPNVKWHDGSPFTAADVVFSAHRMAAPETRDPNYNVIVRNFAAITAPDDMTVRIELKQPDASLIENLGDFLFIVPKAYIERVGSEQFARAPVGTGPFRMVERRPREFTVFEAFKEHWGRVPGVDRLVMRIVPDTQTRVAALQTGEADIVTAVPAHLIRSLSADPKLKIIKVPTFQNIYVYTAMRRDDGTWASREARLALNHAIDRKTLIDKVMFGAATPSAAWCGIGMLGCDIGREPYAYDPKLAKELLAKSGLDLSKTYRFVGLAPGRTPQSKEVAEAISQYLARVGVKTKVEILEYGAWLASLSAKKWNEHDLMFWTRTDYNNDPTARFKQGLRTDGYSAWASNPRFDAMIDEVNTIVDPAAREAKLRELFRAIYDDPPMIVLWTLDEIYGVRSNVQWTPRVNVSWPVLWKVSKTE